MTIYEESVRNIPFKVCMKCKQVPNYTLSYCQIVWLIKRISNVIALSPYTSIVYLCAFCKYAASVAMINDY